MADAFIGTGLHPSRGAPSTRRIPIDEYVRGREQRRAAKPRPIPSVGVVGTGEMSTTIAEKLLEAGLPVTLHGASSELLDEGLARLDARLNGRFRKGEITRSDRERLAQLVCPTCWYVALSSVDIVIVCDDECEDRRANVLAAVERVMKRGAILATTASSSTLDDVVATLLGLANALEAQSPA